MSVGTLKHCSTLTGEILTLQGVGVNEVDGAGDPDANTHLTHVS